jgi:hypothetical protein
VKFWPVYLAVSVVVPVLIVGGLVESERIKAQAFHEGYMHGVHQTMTYIWVTQPEKEVLAPSAIFSECSLKFDNEDDSFIAPCLAEAEKAEQEFLKQLPQRGPE